MPTLEQFALPDGLGVYIAERGGVKVVGVPVGTDEYAMENATEIIPKRGIGTPRVDSGSRGAFSDMS